MKQILIVDNDRDFRSELSLSLEKIGCSVKFADSVDDLIVLVGNSTDTNFFSAVILVWKSDLPHQRLSEFPIVNMPILIISENISEIILEVVNNRTSTSLLFRRNYKDKLANAIERLAEEDDNIDAFVGFADVHPLKVLFVDDSKAFQDRYSTLLKSVDYEVDTASSVNEGYDKACSKNYDMVIIDYQMPDMTGDLLCMKLMRNSNTCGTVKVVFFESYSTKTVKKCLEAGATEFVFKDQSEDMFLARINSVSRSLHAINRIESERENLQSILSSISDGVFGIDCDNKISFINRAALEMLEYREYDLIGADPSEFMFNNKVSGQYPDDRSRELLQAHYMCSFIKDLETKFFTKSGQSITVECSLNPADISGGDNGSVIAFRDVSEKRLFEEELLWQANHDPLTKLLNRHYFEKQLDQEVSLKQRNDDRDDISALLYLDVDRFKYLNDTAGHVAGDQLLIEIGHQLLTKLRASDTMARLGGDEFAFILRELRTHEIPLAANRFRGIIEDIKFEYKGKKYPVTASIGCEVINSETTGPGDVLANADLACHIAKNAGKNKVHVYSAENDDRTIMDVDMGWSSRIRDALGKDKFELVYQPIVPMGSLVGLDVPSEGMVDLSSPWAVLNEDGKSSPVLFEVLLRLANDEGAFFAPDMFLPTAERFNLMIDIDKWVISRALSSLSYERSLGRDIRFSINLSGSTIIDKSLGEYVRKLLNKYEVSGQYVTFEITETSAITNIEAARRLISELKNLGCKFALDDFGSGFSSFGHLKHLDIDYVKIDGLFTQGVVSDAMDKAVVKSINQIAHSFGKMTVAEYIDNSEIVRILSEMGVDYAQGYFISKPKGSLGF
ncbi:MAG: EAL domain-containing protein [Gammaproteobacteria bacterium]|nr:MAG: EAL domain-containing protein [Gammaproteobacteria bacterium]